MRQGFMRLVSASAALIFAGTVAVSAQQVTVTQKGKEFSEKSVTVKVGEEITFINDDSVAHNVYSRVGTQKTDLGLQKPGAEGVLSFDKAGKYRVRCAIHPKMKMTVVVE